MGRTDTVVILIFNQLTPYNAKNFLIAWMNICVWVRILLQEVRLCGVCYIFCVWKFETAETWSCRK
jgi:hypothetical protein